MIKKRFLTYWFLTLIFFTMLITQGVSANEDTQRVFDFADLLTSEEESKLEEKALQSEDAIQTEIYIVTTDNAEGKSSVQFADDFGDSNHFGYEKRDGTYILLLIDMDNRTAWISTSGNAINNFSESRISDTLDAIFEYLPDSKYYESCYAYIEKVNEYMRLTPEEKPSEYDPESAADTIFVTDPVSKKKDTILKNPLICLGIAMAVAGISVGIMAYQAKTHRTAGKEIYTKPGSIRVNHHSDVYTHTTTVKRKIEQNNNNHSGGGSGGGIHTSSSGNTHGGGGRSF